MTARLANAFCVSDRDPSRLEEIALALQSAGEFEVLRPAPGWLVGVQPFPRARGGVTAHAAGLVFCEGADRVLGARHAPDAVAALAREAPQRLGALPGDFTFLAFHADETVTAVRSCGGLVPLYLRRADGGVAISTCLEYLVRFCGGEPRLDPLTNGIWATGWPVFPDGRTFLEGISVVPRGHFVLVGREGARRQDRYWDPRPAEGDELKPDPARPARLRSLLLETLERDLDPTGGNLLALSGGVDSSSLAALIAGRLRLPLSTLSFISTTPAARDRDERYIDAITAALPIEHQRRLPLDQPTLVSLVQRPQRSCCAIVNPALLVLEELSGELPIRVLVGGEYADEIVGTFLHLDDWAWHVSLRQLLQAGPRSWPTSSVRDPLRWGKRRLMRVVAGRAWLPLPPELPEALAPATRAAYLEWRARQAAAAAADRRPLRQLAASGLMDGFMTMNWEATSALGIQRSVPFFTREVLELAFAAHPGEKLGPGQKKLLRTALRDDVPALNLQRDDTGVDLHAPQVTHEWRRELDPLIQPLVREDWFPTPPRRLPGSAAFPLAVLCQVADSVHRARGRTPVAA